ncbi:hypothetical protein PORY_001314 [Pneumocystis oryctolagi]|uniref:Uncharacterized protein n=1 Tax=Pneumocystis oryctolagi TaxID=42067 RepID=A0ACB7CE45_9ASCO|nr:hypothetical protein PORY_001314 [Pneumocystis oryctolagi]
MSDEYLDENFDVKSLRIADLRRILLEYNVDYPSSAKKQVLLDLFHKHVLSRQKAVSMAKQRVINDVHGKEDDNLNIKQVKQKITKKTVSERPENAKTSTFVRRSSTRGSLRKPENVHDTESGETFLEKSYPENVFSNQNLFQKGSPLYEVSVPISSQCLNDNVSSSSFAPFSKVSMEMPISNSDSHVPLKTQIQLSTDVDAFHSKPQKFMTKIEDLKTSKQFHAMAIRGKSSVYTDELQISEDKDLCSDIILQNDQANKKETLEVVQEKKDLDTGKDKEFSSVNKDSRVLCSKLKNNSKRSRKSLFVKFFVMFIFGMSIFVLAAIWREETIRLGYCGVETEGEHLFGSLEKYDFIVIPNMYSSIREKLPKVLLNNAFIYCRPCPSHAICYPNYKLLCEKDYIVTQNIFSINGLIPIPPSCVPDTEKLRKVHIIVNEAIQILRDKNAKLECGSIKLSKGEKEGILEEDLEKYLWEMKSPNINDEQFQELLLDAFEDIEKYDDILVEDDGYLDLIDQKDALNRHLLQIFHSDAPLENISDKDWYIIESRIICSIFFLFKIKSTFFLRKAYKSRISSLVCFSLQRLFDQKRSYISDPKSTYPYVAISHLRDDILINEFNADQRHKLWNKVEKVIENNSNVRTRLAEINGEWMRAWEWVGTT